MANNVVESLSRAQKAQLLCEEKVALHSRNGELSIAWFRDIEKYWLLDGYLKPRYITVATLFPLPEKEKEAFLNGRDFGCRLLLDSAVFGDFQGVRELGFNESARGRRVKYTTSTPSEIDELTPLVKTMGPSLRDLRRDGRAITTDDRYTRLAVIEKIYSADGGFAKRPIVSSILYEIPKGVPERELMTIPVADLEYATTSLCVARCLRLIDKAA